MRIYWYHMGFMGVTSSSLHLIFIWYGTTALYYVCRLNTVMVMLKLCCARDLVCTTFSSTKRTINLSKLSRFQEINEVHKHVQLLPH